MILDCTKKYLADGSPELVKEWSDKNEDYKPTDFTAGSSKKVWWKCKEGHEWEAVIKNRVNGSTCPYCSHRKVLAGVNDLATVRPELALDWSPRNGKLKADMVSEFSNRKVWWKCHVCGYEWQSLISARSGGVKCLCCSGYVTVSGKNDLSITHPVLAKEWSDSNERGVNEYQSNSREYVWWRCFTCGYEWKAVIYNRVQGKCECPACKRAKQIERAVIKEKYLIDMRKFEKHLREVCLMYYFDKAGYELIIRLIRILEAGCRTYDNCMCLQCDDESLESYDWALISLFNALGIAMNVDCERDMRKMFLWYQKYQMSGKLEFPQNALKNKQ